MGDNQGCLCDECKSQTCPGERQSSSDQDALPTLADVFVQLSIGLPLLTASLVLCALIVRGGLWLLGVRW